MELKSIDKNQSVFSIKLVLRGIAIFILWFSRIFNFPYKQIKILLVQLA